MKKILNGLVGLVLVSCGLPTSLKPLEVPSTPPGTVIAPEISTWTSIDTGGSNGKNFDFTKSALSPRLINVGTKLYAIWSEVNASGAAQIRAAVYNSSDAAPSWVFIDSNTTSGLNKDATKAATTPMPTTLNGKLYLSWSETNASAVTQIRVAVYNGNDSSPSWIFVDGNGVNGLNKSATLAAAVPQLTAFNNKLYLTWQENNGSGVAQIRTAVYNGNDSSPSWGFVDGNGANGINKDVTLAANASAFGILGNSLYLTWQERNSAGGPFQIRVAVYNGNDSSPSWNFVDGNTPNGLNKSISSQAKIPTLTTLNSKLYLIWREVNAAAVTQVRIKVFNGDNVSPAWSFIDGGGANGLNLDVTQLATDMSLAVSNSKLYLCWSEKNNAGINQFHIRVYGGNDSTPTWTAVDGGTPNGINKNVANAVSGATCTAFNSALYATWTEGTPGQIMISVGK